MNLDSTTVADLIHKYRWQALGGLAMLIAGGTLTILAHMQHRQVDRLSDDRAFLEQQIANIELDIESFEAYRARQSEIEQSLQEPLMARSTAFSALGELARVHGLQAVRYEAEEAEVVWSDATHQIDRTLIRLVIQSTHEGSLYAFLDNLDRTWGGRIQVKQLSITRSAGGDASADESNNTTPAGLLTTEIELHWRRLLES